MIGPIIGGAFGLLGAMQQRQAMKEHNDALNAGFNLYKPYLNRGLSGASSALADVLASGPYSGQTYAGPNDFQLGAANAMGNYGMGAMDMGNNLMRSTAGFGSNAASLYDQYQDMGEAARADRLSNAIDYANENTGSLVDAVMRDDRRKLTEQTLPGINRSASSSGNMNSSRAGVAEALAQRAFDDRQADVSADIQQNLIDRSLAQQAQQFRDQGAALQGAGQANSQMQGAFGVGANTLGQGGSFASAAGNTLQGFDQAGLDAARADYENQQNFAMNQYAGFMNNILGRAPNASQSMQPNLTNPMTSALGGAMSGYGIQQQYFPGGFGGFGFGGMGGASYGGGGSGFTAGMSPYAQTANPMIL